MGNLGPGDRPAAARRKARRSSSKAPARPLVLAPKRSGVFARGPLKAPDVANRPAAKRKVQRAEERLPGTTLPVKRLPTLAHPTHKQAAAIVREQTRALRGTSVAAKDSAAAGNADRVTRTQLTNARAAQGKLDGDRHVALGVAEVTRDPKAYGLTDGHVARLHALAKQGKLPKQIRGSIARIGAAKLSSDSNRDRVKARAPHSVGAGLEAVAGLHIGKAGTILAAAGAGAAEKARQRLNKGSGGFEHGSLLTNTGKDAIHFPYDVVNTGVQTGLAAHDLARGRPGPAAALVKGIAKTTYETARHPIRSAGEHPLNTALTLYGGYAAAGRAAGAVTRGAGGAAKALPKGGGRVGKTLRAAGDTRRPDLVLEPGARGLRVSRSYSKNLITALEQKRRDRVDVKRGLGDSKGIQFRGSDRSRRHKQRQAVHEFQDMQQNAGRTEREASRRETQTAAGTRVQSRRQGRQVRAEAVRVALVKELRRRGEAAPERMSSLELAKAAERHGMTSKALRSAAPRRSVREVAATKKANVKQRAGRAVPTKVALPRVPFTAKGGAAWSLRPERELLVPAAKQLLGDVRSSPTEVASALRGEIVRLEKAYADHAAEMDLAGRRRNRSRVGAMRALKADLEKGGRAGARAQARVAGLMKRAEEYRRVAGNVSRKHVAAKTLTAEQARAAAFQDYAVSRFADQGVRYDDTRAPTDADAAVHGAAKGKARVAATEARSAGRAAAQARLDAKGSVRGAATKRGQRAARARKPGESTAAYHGSGARPGDILEQGLRGQHTEGSNFGGGVYLTRDRAGAGRYSDGGYVYRVDTHGLKHDDVGGGELVVRGDIPPERISLAPHVHVDGKDYTPASAAAFLRDVVSKHGSLDDLYDTDRALWAKTNTLTGWLRDYAEHGAKSPAARAGRKAARKAAESAAVQRRAASAELYVHEERVKAAVASARKELAAKGLAGEDLTRAVRADPAVAKVVGEHKAVRRRVGKVAAKTRPERKADALWMRERMAAKKAADARTAAVAARRAVPKKPKEFVRGMVVADGKGGERKLTQAEIEQRFRQEYGKDASAPAFVSARPDAQGAGAYFVNWLGRSGSRKSADTYRKTGRSEALGINAHGEQGAIDALVHSQGVLSAAKNWDRFIGAFGVAGPDGKLMQWDEATELARAMTEGRNAQLPGRGPYVPVRVAPGRYDQARIEEILRGQAPGDAEHPKGLISSKVAEALRGEPPADRSARNVVLVPEHVLATFGKHQEMTTSELAKLGQSVTNVFRSSVLPLSTKWLTGNVAEGVLRLAVAGATPVDVALGRRFIRDLIAKDAEWGKTLQVRTQGGLLYGTADRLAVHRDRTMFDETALEGAARGGQTIRHLPGVKQAVDGYMAFAHGVFTFNKMIEQQFQAAVVGKEVRRRVQEDTQQWSKSWQVAVGLGRDAYRDALEGATNTPSQVRFARAIDETLGKYSRFSPQMRRVTQTLAPFLPWYANAARFVYWTLPVKHPILTTLLVNAEQQFAADMAAQAKALPPGGLAADPRRSDGGIVGISRYTPFGAFTSMGRNGEHLAESLPDPLLPQFSSAFAILHGQDAFGRGLKTHDGSDPARAALAAYSMVESFLPFAQLARRLQEHGATAFSDSTFWQPRTKPGTSHGRSSVERIFNPLSPTFLGSKGGKVISAPTVAAAGGGDPRQAKLAELQSRLKVTAADPRMAKLAALQAARAAAGP